jgi:GTP-binding protein
MVSCDCEDVKKEYQILLGELKKYNPELLDKKRILAVTKCDMMDEVMLKQLKRTLPRTVDTIMISSVAGMNIMELKDLIWKKMTETDNGDVE